jgi:hypothetical protein
MDRRGRPPVDPSPAVAERFLAFDRWTAPIAAVLSFGAAAVHFAVISEHVAEFVPYAVLFAGLAWFQLGWGAGYLVRPGRRLARVAIAVNLGTVAVWAVSRTTGLPIGPDPGSLEPVGPLDLLATVLELGLVGLLALRLAPGSSTVGARLSRSAATAVLGATGVMVVVLSSVAFATDPGHNGGAAHDGAAHDHGDSGSIHQEAPSPGTAAGPGASHEVAAPSPSAGAGTTSVSPSLPPTPPPTTPGAITFGARLDVGGQVEAPSSTVHIDATAVWIAQLREAPGTPVIRFLILEARPDGRLTEHWNQEIAVADPEARRITGMATLSLFAHGGPGTYLLRYVRGNDILAEGPFTLVP